MLTSEDFRPLMSNERSEQILEVSLSSERSSNDLYDLLGEIRSELCESGVLP